MCVPCIVRQPKSRWAADERQLDISICHWLGFSDSIFALYVHPVCHHLICHYFSYRLNNAFSVLFSWKFCCTYFFVGFFTAGAGFEQNYGNTARKSNMQFEIQFIINNHVLTSWRCIMGYSCWGLSWKFWKCNNVKLLQT